MQWNEIERRYHEYHDQYPSASMVNITDVDGSRVKYPLRWGIINRESAVIDSIERPTDQNLLSFDDSVPDIRELTYEQLLKLSTPLTRIGQAKVTEDHRSYWRASYEYVRPLEANESRNFDEMVRIVTKLSCILSEPESESFLRSKTYLLANYMAYAVLEALLKGFCQDDVRHDGCLKPGGKIRKLSQNEDYYEYSRNGDTFVSNIGALLLHVEEEVARDGFAD